MIYFILGFSVCLNIILFLIIFFYFKIKDDDFIRTKKRGVKNVKNKQFSKEDFEDIDFDFYGNDF